ncbi:MAG: alkaline phosphatase [Ruminococcaceae bacterium]|nr:alkaline phosphatase [Oscillospiraceae bacterium]
MKRFVFALLSLLLAVTLLVGCAEVETPKSDDNNAASTIPSEDQTQAQIDGKTLNGADISEYTIIYSSTDPDYTKRAAEYIQAQIKERTGVRLFLRSDASAESGREIVVGESSRDISKRLDANTQFTEFAILADEDQIALEGDYFVIAAAAYFFVETYITGEKFNSTVPMEVCVHAPIVEKAENYIVLIGDGMGIYQTQLYDIYTDSSVVPKNFSDGEKQFYGYMLENQGFCRTNSLSGTTDSAAAGTALACGYKTENKLIGQDKNNKNIMSITELAGSLKMATAVMSTEVATGATPAGFSAHAADRSYSSDIAVSQSELTAKYGTIIDCDYDYYTPAQIKTIEDRITDTLSKLSKSENGFFMMYEEAHIDKHCHKNDMLYTYLALIRFNQAIGRFMEYAFYNPNTFVLITADHETGKLLPDSKGGFSYGSTEHSSHYVPVFAHGDGAHLFNNVTIENVQIPKTIASFMGVDDFGDQNDGFKPLG